MENFVPRVQGLIKEKEHGVLLTGVALMTEMCHVDSTIVQQFRTVCSWSYPQVNDNR
jgi:AP-1 complex subunit gamma-1